MPILSNARHEKFAQALAAGINATEAYATAGYKGDRTAASRLSTNVNIRQRVAELQGKAARKAEVTMDSLLVELEEARTLAIAEKQTSAAVSATMGKAKLTGLIVEKREHTGRNGGPIQTVDLTKLSGDELAQLESIFGPLAGPGDDDAIDPSGEGAQAG